MFGLSRFARLFLLLTALIVIPTLYLLYPSPSIPRSPADAVSEYEAGGIDSDHWRTPVKPDFEKEEARDWEDEVVIGCPTGEDCDGTKDKANDGLVESVLDGGVIMPKLENATAKSVAAMPMSSGGIG